MGDRLEYPELGCWGDGTLGHQHTRERCADALYWYGQTNFFARGSRVPEFPSWERVIESLKQDMPDDSCDEDWACDWLNEHAPFAGAWWGWLDGDFGLWPEFRHE